MKGADQCPRCGSRRWATVAVPSDFYADVLSVCRNPACKTIWEPFDPAELLDPKHEPLGAFKHPCGNCAFRKGSPELVNGRLEDILGRDGIFHCHKGVPIAPATENGFDYPAGGKDPLKLRLCRGFINQFKIPPFEPEEECD